MIEHLARRFDPLLTLGESLLLTLGENMYPQLKATVRLLLGEQGEGMLLYLRRPKLGSEWGGPFNGQPFRRDLFLTIIKQLCPVAIVETGTYYGLTTNFMAQTKLPIFTIEGDPRKHGFARARLWRQRNVKLLLQDSRSALHKLLEGPLSGLTSRRLFFYLDAHWTEDLPLAEELEIILSRCASPVIMIDDFQVPDDPGYAYDDYGSGKALTPEYIAPAVKAHDLRAFYPATRSSDEGGMRRGCVVLTKNINDGQRLTAMPLLRTASDFRKL